ncbi:MAG: thiamine-phosphate kinase [Pseudomonadota bacterium]|nr:thiamine-phosphate kinase [Pseudomonadota bacterium]
MAALTEFELIDRFFRRPAKNSAAETADSTVLGIGDDAALLSPTFGHQLAASVDMLVAGRHFFADADPESLGHKTLAVNLSDMAAMGATPRWALLAGALPDADANWLDAFSRGFFALAAAHAVDLVGGDTTRGPLNLCVTILGEVPAGKAILRSGARPGDSIWVSGVLGDASLALAHVAGRLVLSPEEALACQGALLRPVPRVALGIGLRDLASAAIDISDGLVGDLGHILAASQVGATVELAAVPRSPTLDRALNGAARDVALQCLLAGGDDYELCFTAAPADDSRIAALASALGLALQRVGTVVVERGLIVRDGSGKPLAALPRAYDHFAP